MLIVICLCFAAPVPPPKGQQPPREAVLVDVKYGNRSVSRIIFAKDGTYQTWTVSKPPRQDVRGRWWFDKKGRLVIKDDDYPNQPRAVESWAAAFEREGGKWVATDGIHELKE